METDINSTNTSQPLPQTNQIPNQPVVESQNSKLVKVLLYVIGAVVFMAIGAFGFWIYENQTKGKQTSITNTTPIPSETSSTSLPSVEPKPSNSSDLKMYKDSLYGYTIKYPSSWQINPFTNKDDYYNVIRSGVTFEKAGYEVTINNYGKIPKSGCGGLITSKNNFLKINVPLIELWRSKIEEGKVDGMVAINPQGAEFVTLNLGTFEKVQTTAPNTDGSLDCNFLVNNYRYEILYKLPIIGEENLKNINKETLTEMDKIVTSLIWAE
ncbi:MAG: hypothetical protein ABH867_03795 [Patescibacteria group bacterium]